MDRQTLLLIVLLLIPSERLQALAVGDSVPDFQRPLFGSAASAALSDYAGKVIYLDFWASWCGPCRQSLPALNRLYRELGERGFVVLAVNVDTYRDEALAFLQRHPVSYPVLRDADNTLPKRFAVKGMPTAFLIGRDGRVAHVHEGFRKSDTAPLRQKITALLED